jgi:hypothetical protein
MAFNSYTSGARPGIAAAEITNGKCYLLIVRIPDDPDGGFEMGFESMSDADEVKAAAKNVAPDFADAIDAAFA